MRAIRVHRQSQNADRLDFELVKVDLPKLRKNECLIKVHGSSVNPSDVKALLGKMPYLVWPRIPGRDYAGIVIDGPRKHVGKQVWGTGGDLGMKRNGNHAEFAIIQARAIHEKPGNISLLEAGAIGVPWTCAWLGIIKGAQVQAGETVAVIGANGKVGEAAIQLATGEGANVIAVERNKDKYFGHTNLPVELINLSRETNLKQAILNRTEGEGVNVILNSVGSPYFEVANECLAKEGRQIIISTKIEENKINLRAFYRGNHKLVGVSNMDYDNVASGKILENIKGGFEKEIYKPYLIKDENVFNLDNIGEGYKLVLNDLTRERVLVDPQD